MAVKKKDPRLDNGREFLDALNLLCKERGIDKEKMLATIENGLIKAYEKQYSKNVNVRASIDRTTGIMEVLAAKNVVEEVADELAEISLEEARKIDSRYNIGDIIETSVTPTDFGRIAAQTAKQSIIQFIHEAEREKVYDDYIEKENEIMTAIVQRVDGKNVYVDLGKTEGLLEPSGQMPGETYEVNDHLKVYVLEVNRSVRGPQVLVSRTHPSLVKRLFEMEVSEIRSGIVQIKSIAREAGYRTKMSVFSTDPAIDSVGSCVGPKGMRVENVVAELKTEKIDIVKWSPDPVEYIASALNPARVVNVSVRENEKAALVVVPDNQLSLAIGKEGQNVRLAAKLTGWKIDIKSQSQILESAAAFDEVEIPETGDYNNTEE